MDNEHTLRKRGPTMRVMPLKSSSLSLVGSIGLILHIMIVQNVSQHSPIATGHGLVVNYA